MSGTTATDRVSRDPNASLDWMRQIQLQQRASEEDNGVLRNVYKRAKSAGENVKAMRIAIRMLRSQSPEEIIAELGDVISYLRMRKLDVTAESLFDGMNMHITEKTQHADDMWDAGEKGYRAGRLGARIEDAPYNPGTELHVEWEREWKRGQAAIARELGPDAQQASASRERPRRATQTRIPGTEEKQPSPRKKAADTRKAGNGPGTKKAAAVKRNGRAPRRLAGPQIDPVDGVEVH